MKEKHPHSNPKQDGPKKETTNRHVYVEPGVQIDFVQDLKDQHQAEQYKNTTNSNKQLFWTKVTAFLVLIYALLTFWQARSTNRLVAMSQAQQRPCLWPVSGD